MALRGLKVIELAGLAPAPFCGMVLSDFGANVIRIERPNQSPLDPLRRGKRTACINLKIEEGKEAFRTLCKSADVLIEPFRPGVMEKLELGPKSLIDMNKRLIYARLSGFGQNGLYSKKAGHDINYLAQSGVLSLLTSNEKPIPPINLLADFAGGGMMCALGILIALQERNKSGIGQIVDVSMVDGTRYISSYLWRSKADDNINSFVWPNLRKKESNLLDGGAHFYTCYKTKDSRWISVGCIEPQFYEVFLKTLDLDITKFPQFETNQWPEYKNEFRQIFASRTFSEWVDVFKDTDCCVEPVLEMNEIVEVDKRQKRQSSFLDDGSPRPTPLLSRTPAQPDMSKGQTAGYNTVEILMEGGYSVEDIKKLLAVKAINFDSLPKL